MINTSEVLFEERIGLGGNLGMITLNRPNALNALTDGMVEAIGNQLKIWAQQPDLKAVVISGNGRAFCAGGDLRLTYEGHVKYKVKLHPFFRHEYRLNRDIHHFPKPYIALLDGITMGGGAGVSIHGSHRIATDRLVFAMPETGIGFFPDVGGTYFLPRLLGRFGYYLGVTGAKISADDSIALGLAQHKVDESQLENVVQAILDQPLGDHPHQAVTSIIERFALPIRTAPLVAHQALIDTCFSALTLEGIIQKLHESNTPFADSILDSLHKKSPTSLKVSLRAIQLGATLTFDQCIDSEYKIACHFLEAHDFFEGIRALIIDKDQAPLWQPDTIQAVTDKIVDSYFNSSADSRL
jgi:enoyl-CoA hydratase